MTLSPAVAILDEAIIAFELNSGLFTTLKAPAEPRRTDSPTPSVTLGDPSTPIEGEMIPPAVKKDQESKIVYEADVFQASGGFSFASVFAFILALCLSQIFIVSGGFTGESGLAKLQAVWHRFEDLFSTH